jgi:hypothetical protein
MLAPTCYMEHAYEKTSCRRSAVWQRLVASCVAIMRRCCLRLKSAGAEASSWHVAHHTLQMSQAYLHAPVTCAELSACTTTAIRASPLLFSLARRLRHSVHSPPARSAWQPCHTHGSVFIMRPYTTQTTSVILTLPSTVPSTHSRRSAHRICFGGMPGGPVRPSSAT